MVDLFEWHEACSVGVREFDDDHRRLFALANRLVNLDARLPDPVALGEILDALADYAESHFPREEAALQQADYPGIGEHRRRHREFRNALLLYKGQHRAGHLRVGELARYVTEWILSHEEEEGHYLRPHLAARVGM